MHARVILDNYEAFFRIITKQSIFRYDNNYRMTSYDFRYNSDTSVINSLRKIIEIK